MSFLKGSVSFSRFRAEGKAPSVSDIRAALQKYAFQPVASGEEFSSGWVDASDILDTQFNNLDYGEWVLFALRTDVVNVPSSVAAIELRKMLMNEPNKPSKARKQELKEQVLLRLRSKALAVPGMKGVAWNVSKNEVWYEGTSVKQIDAFIEKFAVTFGINLAEVTPTGEAERLGKDAGSVEMESSDFGAGGVEAKTPDDALSRDFLMWLWARESIEGPMTSVNGESYAVYANSSLSLCNAKGSMSISGGEDEDFSEARHAVMQSGRVLSRAGFTVQKGDLEWKLSLKTGSVTPSGIKKPKYQVEGDDAEDALVLLEMGGAQEMIDLFDALYEKFLGVRFSGEWGKFTGEVAEWSKR